MQNYNGFTLKSNIDDIDDMATNLHRKCFVHIHTILPIWSIDVRSFIAHASSQDLAVKFDKFHFEK